MWVMHDHRTGATDTRDLTTARWTSSAPHHHIICMHHHLLARRDLGDDQANHVPLWSESEKQQGDLWREEVAQVGQSWGWATSLRSQQLD